MQKVFQQKELGPAMDNEEGVKPLFTSLPTTLELEVTEMAKESPLRLHKSDADSKIKEMKAFKEYVTAYEKLENARLSPQYSPLSEVNSLVSPPTAIDQLLVPLFSATLTTSDYESPRPNVTYSDPYDGGNSQTSKVLDELTTSETTYLISLQMLKRFYIDPLITAKRDVCGAPILFFQVILEKLIEAHSQTAELFLQLKASKSSHFLAYVEAINLVAINLHYYEEYCNIYDDVLLIFRANNTTDKFFLNRVWSQSLQLYLEATQPATLRMDLSFISLIQRPISRISKYRLIIESLIKTLTPNYTAFRVQTLLESIKVKLNEINDDCKHFKKIEKTSKVNEILNFAAIDKFDFNISLEFFGKPLLIGVLTAVWLEDRIHKPNFKGQVMAAFLYKSHLLLSDVNKTKGDVSFVIALSRCQITIDSKDSVGGLYSDYPYTIKLTFEIGFRQYEILLILLTKREFLIWRDNLVTMIDIVNGVYPLDFSNSCIPVVGLIQERMKPSNICLKDYATYKKYKDMCYFYQSVSIGIAIDFSSIDFEDLFPLTGYFNCLDSEALSKSKFILQLRKLDRLAAERVLHDLISSELPVLFYKEPPPPARQSTLRKSATWTLARFRVHQSYLKTQSNEDVEPSTAASTAKSLASFSSTRKNHSSVRNSVISLFSDSTWSS